MEVLLGKTLSELQTIAVEAGLPRFVGKQLCEWLYRKCVTSFDQMTNISLKARQALQAKYVIGRITPTAEAVSQDGTRKYLFPASVSKLGTPTDANISASDGEERRHTSPLCRPAASDATVLPNAVECVYLPEDDRATLCVSTQAGCKMGCKFCMTGTLGFHGNLSADAILAQVLHFLSPYTFSLSPLTNLVLMGEGEPMDNIDNVLRALNVLTSDWGLGWSPKRITVSTVGFLQKPHPTSDTQHQTPNIPPRQPALQRFLEETDCHLAISLHNPNATERAAIMPAERLTPISEVLDLVRRYDWSKQRRQSFEYICWAGVNDDQQHAKQLLRLLQGLPCRVNLIRFHSGQQTADSNQHASYSSLQTIFPASDEQRMIAFRDYLSAHGVTCTIRKSRGEDILAACGMLVNALSKE